MSTEGDLALHIPWLTSALRVATALLGAAMLAAAARLVYQAITGSAPWPVALVAVVLLTVPTLAAVVVFSLRAAYATPEGLVVEQGGERRTVPWSQVGEPFRPWWAVNAATPVTEVPLASGEKLRLLGGARTRAEIQRRRQPAAP